MVKCVLMQPLGRVFPLGGLYEKIDLRGACERITRNGIDGQRGCHGYGFNKYYQQPNSDRDDRTERHGVD